MNINDVKERFNKVGVELSDDEAERYLQMCEDVAALAENYDVDTTKAQLREWAIKALKC